MAGPPVPEMPGTARVAAVVTLAQGLAVLVFGVAVAGVLVPSAALDPWWAEEVRLLRGGLAALVVIAATGALVLLHAVGALGLWRGRPWARYLAVMLGILALPGACLPVGLVLLVLLSQPEVRAWLDADRPPERPQDGGSPEAPPAG